MGLDRSIPPEKDYCSRRRRLDSNDTCWDQKLGRDEGTDNQTNGDEYTVAATAGDGADVPQYLGHNCRRRRQRGGH